MNKKVKVLQVIPTLGLGGAEIMVENLSIALAEDGFNSAVVSLYNCQSAITARLENKNIPIYFLGKKTGFDIKTVFRLIRLFCKEKPDVIHTHLYAIPYVMPAAIIAKVQVRIHTIHSLAEKEVGSLRRKINKFFFKYCRVVPIAISPIVKKSVVKEYKLSEEQVPMVYNGIDLKRCISKEDYQINNKNINIIHIGSFKTAKNHAGLIECFKIVHESVPSARLYLIGFGELECLIRDKVSKFGLNDCIVFLGAKSDVYKYLNKADIFVLPSLWEGMPIALIEAMSTGLPIVATNVGGISDMIKDNVSGLLVEIDNEQITEALLKLIKDTELRQRLGNAARVASERFSAQDMATSYERLYKKLIPQCKN